MYDTMQRHIHRWHDADCRPFAIVIGGCYFVVKHLYKQYARYQLRQIVKRKREECRSACRMLSEKLAEDGLSIEVRDQILALSMIELQQKLQSGTLKAVDVLKAYQSRAIQVNETLNCVVEPIWEAEMMALNCDLSTTTKRPLHGIPISVKENYLLEGYDSTIGCAKYIDVPAVSDSVIIKVLKMQGAVPFVRTNIPQTTLSACSSNPIYGRTNNPHDVSRCPCGSSSGEGALVAAGGSILGLGNDIGGSIRLPCNACGLCGLKPTANRISFSGMFPLLEGQTIMEGCNGPIARDVDSLVLFMKSLLVPAMFELDTACPPIPFRDEIFTNSRRLRIGYYTYDGVFQPVTPMERAVNIAKDALQRKGHQLVAIEPPNVSYATLDLWPRILMADGGRSLVEMLKYDELDPSISMMIKMMKMSKSLRWLIAKIAGLFDKSMAKFITASLGCRGVSEWWNLVISVKEYRKGFLKMWQSQKLDAVICPGAGCIAPPHELADMCSASGMYTALYNVLNFPAGTVPVTKVNEFDQETMANYKPRSFMENIFKKAMVGAEGLPVNVQVVGLPYQEELVLRVMKELEDDIGQLARQ